MIYSPLAELLFVGLSQFAFFLAHEPYYSPICQRTEGMVKEENTMLCLEKTPGFNDVKQAFINAKNSTTNYHLIKEVCTFRPKGEDCLEKMKPNETNCIDPKIYKQMEVWKKIEKELSDYVCKNDAEIAHNIFVKAERTCWDHASRDIMRKCTDGMNPTLMYNIPDLVRHCQQIDEFKTCMVKNLPEVCPQNVVDSAEPIFRIVEDNLCKDTNIVPSQERTRTMKIRH